MPRRRLQLCQTLRPSCNRRSIILCPMTPTTNATSIFVLQVSQPIEGNHWRCRRIEGPVLCHGLIEGLSRLSDIQNPADRWPNAQIRTGPSLRGACLNLMPDDSNLIQTV